MLNVDLFEIFTIDALECVSKRYFSRMSQLDGVPD